MRLGEAGHVGEAVVHRRHGGEMRRTAAAAGRRFDWVAVTVLATAVTYFASFVHYGLNLGEDGNLVYLIYRTFCGQQPYVDFSSGYGPGFFYFNAFLFRLFGPNLVVIRWPLVVVNALAVFALYYLARMVVPRSLAALPALAYAALMLVFPGEDASFNIAYPAWYVVLTFAASTLAFLRGAAGGSVRWVVVAGVLAGLGCAFKPNTGAFDLAALALMILFSTSPHGRPVHRVCWWGLLVGLLLPLAAAWHFDVGNRDARLLLWPIFALVVARALTAPRVVPTAFEGRSFPQLVLALLGGFAATTLPWLVYFWWVLGTPRFLSEVLFIGSGHTRGYYLPVREFDLGDYAVAAGATAIAVGTWLVKRGRLSPQRIIVLVTTLAIAAGAALLWAAPMPEGFWRAATQALQQRSFGAAVVVHWAGIGLLFTVVRGRAPDLLAPKERVAIMALTVGAPMMYLSLYPRSDFFHWVLSAPLTLVLAVALYWLLLRAWMLRPALAWRAGLPGYAVVVLLAWPGICLGARLLTDGGGFVHSHLDRAPVVLERGRQRRLDDLQRTVAFVTAHSGGSATLLGFPNLHLLNFLAGRHVPGRYGAFHPGWPDHLLEAETVSALEVRRTPLIVTTTDVEVFEAHAPLYYFLLRYYVRRHYELAARIGPYDILQRRDRNGAPATATASDETIGRGGLNTDRATAQPGEPYGSCAEAVAMTERLMPESAAALSRCWSREVAAPVQRRAVEAARATHDPLAGVMLAEALRAGILAPTAGLAAVRTIGEVADARTVPALVGARAVTSGRVRDELDTALMNIAMRSVLGRFMFVPITSGEDAVRADAATRPAALEWLASSDPRLRLAGAWVAGVTKDQRAVPGLQKMLTERDAALRAMAGDALLRLGEADGIIGPLVDGLADDDLFLPSVVLTWCEQYPDRVPERVADVFEHGTAQQREMMALISGALGDPVLGDALRGRLRDPVARVRAASAWGLGALRIESARSDLEHVSREDPAAQVRGLAQAALEAMGARRAQPVVDVKKAA